MYKKRVMENILNKYFNPSNEEYKALCEKPYYVDKTAILAEIKNINYPRERKVSAFMPEGFGKTSILDMVTAFYSKGCDSRELFADKKIAETPNWDEDLNKYDVFRINMSEVLKEFDEEISNANENSKADYISLENGIPNEYSLTNKINGMFYSVLKKEFPEDVDDRITNTRYNLRKIYDNTKHTFILIFDDYDAVYLKEEYRKYFKNYDDFLDMLLCESTFYIEKCFVFGKIERMFYRLILSSDMRNASLIDCSYFKEMVGFTEDEVKELCTKFNMNFNDIEEFFGAYRVNRRSDLKIYNASSILSLIRDYNCDLSLYRKKDFCDPNLKKLLSFNNDVYEKNSPYLVELKAEDNFKNIRFRGIYERLYTLLKHKVVTYDYNTYFYINEAFNQVEVFFEFLCYLGYLQELDHSHKSVMTSSVFLIPNKEMEETLNATLNEIPEFKVLDEMYNNSSVFFQRIMNYKDSYYVTNYFKKMKGHILDFIEHKDSFLDFVNIIFNCCTYEYNYKAVTYPYSIGAVLTPKNYRKFEFWSIRLPIIFFIQYSPVQFNEDRILNDVNYIFKKEIRKIVDHGYTTDRDILLIAINVFGNILEIDSNEVKYNALVKIIDGDSLNKKNEED